MFNLQIEIIPGELVALQYLLSTTITILLLLEIERKMSRFSYLTKSMQQNINIFSLSLHLTSAGKLFYPVLDLLAVSTVKLLALALHLVLTLNL